MTETETQAVDSFAGKSPDQTCRSLPFEVWSLIAEFLLERSSPRSVADSFQAEDAEASAIKEILTDENTFRQYQGQKAIHRLASTCRVLWTFLTPLIYRHPVFSSVIYPPESSANNWQYCAEQFLSSIIGSATCTEDIILPAAGKNIIHSQSLGNLVRTLEFERIEDIVAINKALSFMPNLTGIALRLCWDEEVMVGSTIAVLAEHCPRLTEIVIRNARSLPFFCIPDLMKMNPLVTLYMREAPVLLIEVHPPLGALIKCADLCRIYNTDQLELLLRRTPNLEIIEKLHSEGAMDSTMALMVTCTPFLRSVNLSGCTYLTRSCIPDLIKFECLTCLRIDQLEWIVEAYPPLGELVKVADLSYIHCTSRLRSYLRLVPNLEKIMALHKHAMTDFTLSVMATHNPSLKLLYLTSCRKLTRACIPDLLKLTRLSTLRVDAVEWIVEAHPPLGLLVDSACVRISEIERLKAFIPLIPRVKSLNLDYHEHIDDSVVKVIANFLPKVEQLSILKGSSLTEACFSDVKRLKALRDIKLGCERMGDVDAVSLIYALPNLKYLSLQSVRVTDDFVNWLIQEFKLRQVGDPTSRLPRSLTSVIVMDSSQGFKCQRKGESVSGFPIPG